jgi:hypothetical protein
MNNKGTIENVSGRGRDINYENSGRTASGNFRFAFRSNIKNTEDSQSINFKNTFSGILDNATKKTEEFKSTVTELQGIAELIAFFV